MKYTVILLLGLLFRPEIQAQQSPDEVRVPSGRSNISLGPDFHLSRRMALRKLMPDRSLAVIFSATDKVRSNDVNYPFHQDPNFYYLTGLKEPNSLIILFKEPFELQNDTVNEIIFVPGRSKEYEQWNGPRLGTVGVRKKLMIQAVFVNSEFADFKLDFSYFDHIFFSYADGAFQDDTEDRGDIASMKKHFELKTESLGQKLDEKKLRAFLATLREVKSDEELEIMQRAIDITCEAQVELMKHIDTSFTENKSEALVEYVFRKSGAESPGFPSIVGGGKNSCTLHYTSNDQDLNAGDLLVVDVGAEYRGYTADITRTIPVNGVYTQEQRAIYELVLKAQSSGIEQCIPGKKFWAPHLAATEVIQKGLKDLGIIKKHFEARQYFMHGTSHYLGLDVHDVGSYQALLPGNVITVEPGIYIPEGSDCDPKWWNIGIRIEDDVLITAEKPVILSACVPRSIEEIENLMDQ